MTEMLTAEIAEKLADCSPEKIEVRTLDLLRMEGEDHSFDEETVAVIGMPVYVGKMPVPGISAIRKLSAAGSSAVLAVSYGGRTFGNALYELQHFAEEQGFRTIGAGAFAVKHKGKRGHRHHGIENSIDMETIRDFGNAASAKIRRLAGSEIEGLKIKPAPVEVSGRLPIHRVSRISPAAAAVAQEILEKLSIRHRQSEWYL